jgi:hypothetical protein
VAGPRGELLCASERAVHRSAVFVYSYAGRVHQRGFVEALLAQETLCRSARVDERGEEVDRRHPIAPSLAQGLRTFDDLRKLWVATLEHRDFSFTDAPTWPKKQRFPC